VDRREPQASAEPLRGGVAADQRTDAAAVDQRDTAQVDDHMALPRRNSCWISRSNDSAARRDERHLGRQDEAAVDASLGHSEPIAANYTPSPGSGVV
jgi:hypothetical protein